VAHQGLGATCGASGMRERNSMMMSPTKLI